MRGRHFRQGGPHVLDGQIPQRDRPDKGEQRLQCVLVDLYRFGCAAGETLSQPVGHRLLDRVAVRSPDARVELRVHSSLSLSLTSVRVLPLTFLRIRLPSPANPSETTPRHRPAQVRCCVLSRHSSVWSK